MKLSKRYPFFALAFLVAAALAFAPAALAQPAYQQSASQNDIVEGVLSVKFSPEAVVAVETAMNARGTITRTDAQGVPQTSVPSIDQINERFGVTEMQRLVRPAGKFEQRHREAGMHRWYVVRLPREASLQDAVNAYNADPRVTLAEYQLENSRTGYRSVMGGNGQRASEVSSARRDSREQAARQEERAARAVPNDPRFGDQWHYDNTASNPGTPGADISLPEAHNIETGDPSVIVSVHDGGIDVDHEDIEANMWINEDEIPGNGVDDDNNGYVDDIHGYDFAGGSDPVIDADDHGTHTAGTVGAVTNNGVGVAGVAGGNGSPDSGVRLMSMQVFDPGFFAPSGGFAESFLYAADNGAVVSQNSWGRTTPGSFEQSMLEAIDYFIANAGSEPDAPIQGGVVAFATGNEGSTDDYYYGYYPPTIAVASTDINDSLSAFSNYGEWADISAPGGTDPAQTSNEEDVLSSTPNGTYQFFNGTSMATPHVSGVLALIASASPGLTNEAVRDILESSADDISAQNPGVEGLIGSGRLNAFRAVSSLDADDDTPPGTISDLTASLVTGGNNAELTWTAPADDAGDPASGSASGYQVAYTTSGPITDAADFADATPAPGVSTPAEPGMQDGTVITGLDFGTQYWFAVQATDDNANTSLSNSPSLTTNPAPELAYSPDTLSAELETGATTTVPLTLENVGPGNTELSFTFPAFASEAARARAARQNDVSRPIRDADYRRSDGSEDPHRSAGHPVLLGAGGPDEFGYEWIDSNEEGGPTYNFIDIADVGTALNLTGADDSETVDLPFVFEFYGETQTQITISSNGYATFGDDGVDYTNDPIPSGDEPNALIAPFWDDLEPDSGDFLYYDDAENDRFIVQWNEVEEYSGSPSQTYTFQFILNDDGSILFQYEDMEGGGDLEAATVGIENAAGDVGLQVAFNTPYVENGLAVALAAPPEFITSVQPASGAISGGGSQVVDVTFDASEIDEGGLYEDELTVETNDPESQLTAIPAALLASFGSDVPDIAVRPSEIDFGAVPVDDAQGAIDSFYVANEGTVPLEVSGIEAAGDTSVFELAVFPPSPVPITVPAGDSVQVNVSFTPDAPGTYAATVTLASDDPDEASATLELTGEGAPPASGLVINEVLASVPAGDAGDANEDGTRDAEEDVFVELANVSGGSIDLSGYTLNIDEQVRHTFPDGTTLRQGVGVTIFGGGALTGTIPGVVQTASSGSLALGEAGGVVVLRAPGAADTDRAAAIAYGDAGSAPAPSGQSMGRDPDFYGAMVPHAQIGIDYDDDGAADLFSPGFKNAEQQALPVEVTAFSAEEDEDGQAVLLRWRTASETNNAGFHLQQRRQGETGWVTVNDALIEGAGTSLEPQTYSHRVEELRAGTYAFRLQQVDYGSTPTVYDQTVEATVRPQGAYDLRGAAPNPFRTRTTFTLDVREAQDVTVDVYDALGRRVQRLYRGPVEPGEGKTFTLEGGALSSGVYIYHVKGERFVASGSVVLVR